MSTNHIDMLEDSNLEAVYKYAQGERIVLPNGTMDVRQVMPLTWAMVESDLWA